MADATSNATAGGNNDDLATNCDLEFHIKASMGQDPEPYG